MVAGRGHKTLGSETKDSITHGIASNRSISIFALVPLVSKSHEGNVIGPVNTIHAVGLHCSGGTLELGNLSLL